ncbi:conserved hypothetical protein [Shewanella denitrificans OS217]|jgi:uncharacterized protein (TIGR02444 family)|uniref:TIGR02444 family protein n=1 Tax=Shewanella denitrificans (strain OS217 / ATCC BAA-1090 / DSM 15013) TaxID=318161 RepID=Q12JC1_SHEDO|nr:TIGR02444 family protein [Shewanella denitrificans]ABE56455.1 conserved hypothetical protein [Shewanella denitrificans OS217]
MGMPMMTPQKYRFSPQLWQDCEQYYLVNTEHYLSLQDTYQVNVNLLLLAQYLDQQALFFNQQQWESLTACIELWENNVVQPYRKLRRLTKPHMDSTEYEKMLNVELIMERKSQQMLLQRLNQLQADGDASNINNYLSLFGLDETVVA